MNKYLILLAALLMCSTLLFAQQSDGSMKKQLRTKEGGEAVFNPHGFLSLQGGAAYTLGEAGFGDLISPSLAVALGYKFTPLFGLRAEASGWQAKGGWVNPTSTYQYKYLQGSVDAMLDLSNLCCGFNPKRFFNTYFFLGVGLNGAFGNDEAVALSAGGHNLYYLWAGKKLYIAGRGGLGANFRLNDHVSINLEVNTNLLSDKFNSKKGVNVDWHFNALAGLVFTIGKSYKKTALVYHEPEQFTTTTTVVEQPKPAPVVEQVLPKEEAVKESMKQNIFFALNSARIQDDQQTKITFLVEYLEKHPTAKVSVTGYADVNTGNPKINSKLSESRASNVAEILKSRGISATRITVDFKGDTIQPYAISEENRVSICVAE